MIQRSYGIYLFIYLTVTTCPILNTTPFICAMKIAATTSYSAITILNTVTVNTALTYRRSICGRAVLMLWQIENSHSSCVRFVVFFTAFKSNWGVAELKQTPQSLHLTPELMGEKMLQTSKPSQSRQWPAVALCKTWLVNRVAAKRYEGAGGVNELRVQILQSPCTSQLLGSFRQIVQLS